MKSIRQKGGLAGSYAYNTEKDRINYIKEVYETIVTRDLVQKYALPDTLILQRLCEFLMDNISNLTSPNKVSKLLTANDIPANHVTIGKYIKYLCNAFVFYDIKRYDIRGKNILKALKSFICVIREFDMQYLETETWIMAGFMKIWFVLNCCVEDMMFM